ncbi:helix-turn-helix domain-containing protein [Agrobacterium rosae]|nr:helix-turn-helix domain-containing protein [Agrobacterium rosae]MCM2433670.1 hypothetical protein [Agrobacterium rosae]MDX8329772.1 helix-turn-helix domain-containing protein [Agrobacterium rosae]
MSLNLEPSSPASTIGNLYPTYRAGPASPVPEAHRLACQRVREITCTLFADIVDRDMVRRDRRHAMSHIRQIALYVSHVSLSLPIREVAVCFGRDPSTVSITCQRVEDRRDDEGFDAFVTAVEQAAHPIRETLQAGAQ